MINWIKRVLCFDWFSCKETRDADKHLKQLEELKELVEQRGKSMTRDEARKEAFEFFKTVEEKNAQFISFKENYRVVWQRMKEPVNSEWDSCKDFRYKEEPEPEYGDLAWCFLYRNNYPSLRYYLSKGKWATQHFPSNTGIEMYDNVDSYELIGFNVFTGKTTGKP